MHWLLGVLIVAGGWIGLRLSVGARAPVPVLALVLDALPPAIGFLLLTLATGRPVLGALAILAAIAGLVLTDRVKRAVLREPVVFADRAELLEVVRHPRLYLPFAGTGLVLGGAAAAVAAVALLAWLEPPVLRVHLWLWPLLLLAGWGCFWLPAQRPFLPALAAAYARLAPTRDPAADMARFGMLGCFIIHATLARAERPARQGAANPPPLPDLPPGAGPIVMVQSESWFDITRLHPDLASTLPHLARLREEAVLQGLLTVPAWGANTVRSECAVLTGLNEAALGLDRFNPYAGFARTQLPSIAWQAKRAGYRTVCVHPFHLSFYGRATVLPLLGFDELIGPEAFFSAERGGEWVCDRALGEEIARVIRRGEEKLFVFAITMECHGPWDGAADRQDAALTDALPPVLRDVPGAAELARYVRRLRGADGLLPVVQAALRESGRGWLAFFGDHQPSLPATFGALGLQDPRTDYVIWRAPPAGAPAARRDIAAHELGAALLAEIARA